MCEFNGPEQGVREMAQLRRVGLRALGLIVAVSFAVAGCGDNGGSDGGGSGSATGSTAAAETVQVDVGNGKKIEVPRDRPKVAFFAWINNAYTKAYSERVQAQAKAKGMKIEFFDSGGDPKKQFAQLQNALQRKEYNAFIVLPADGKLQCKLLSKQAPAAGVVVQVSVLPPCNRDLNAATAEGQWEPGTLNTAGAENLVAYKVGWLKEVEDRLSGSKEIGIVAGIPIQGNWLSMKKALEQFPDIKRKIVATQFTDFTTPKALAEAQTMLRAHPKIDLIISMYSDITRGVMKALDGAGMLGKVKVVDIGASSYSLREIKAGNLDFTAPYNPIGNADAAVDSIAKAFRGERVARYIDDFAAAGLGTQDKPLAIDKTNVDSFDAQY